MSSTTTTRVCSRVVASQIRLRTSSQQPSTTLMWLRKMVLLSLLTGNLRPLAVQSFSVARQRGRPTARRWSTRLLATPATSFDDGKRPFEITTPIYYVNDKPHIGHAYTSTGKFFTRCFGGFEAEVRGLQGTLTPPRLPACDVIARFMRLSGREVFFLSGTDEHGQKVEQSAAKQGIEPQAFVDEVSANFRDLLDLLNISNDRFIRTTEENHKKSVQVGEIFLDGSYPA